MGEWSTHASATNHTTRHDLARGLAQIVTEQEESAAWHDCKKLVEKENLRGFTLRCSQEIRCSFFAVNSQRVVLGETRDYADTVTVTRVGGAHGNEAGGRWVCWVCDGLKGGVSFSAQAQLSTKPALCSSVSFRFIRCCVGSW